MPKQYRTLLGLSLCTLLHTSPLLADEVLVPWAPAVIDSDEQAEAERRARSQVLESMRTPAENTEEAWMKKFNPEPEEDALAEESNASADSAAPAATRHAATGRPPAKASATRHAPENMPSSAADRHKPLRPKSTAENPSRPRNAGNIERRVIPFSDQRETRSEAASSAVAQEYESTTKPSGPSDKVSP